MSEDGLGPKVGGPIGVLGQAWANNAEPETVTLERKAASAVLDEQPAGPAAPINVAAAPLPVPADMDDVHRLAGETGHAGLQSFATLARDIGVEPALARGAVAFLRGQVEFDPSRDEADAAETHAELSALWREELGSNIAAINAYLDGLPNGGGEIAHRMRVDGGRALLNHAGVLQRLLPSAKAAASHQQTISGDVNQQIAGIERLMRTDRAAYNADNQLQARYRELLTQRGA
jgi:hypothetical protein